LGFFKVLGRVANGIAPCWGAGAVHRWVAMPLVGAEGSSFDPCSALRTPEWAVGREKVGDPRLSSAATRPRSGACGRIESGERRGSVGGSGTEQYLDSCVFLEKVLCISQ